MAPVFQFPPAPPMSSPPPLPPPLPSPLALQPQPAPPPLAQPPPPPPNPPRPSPPRPSPHPPLPPPPTVSSSAATVSEATAEHESGARGTSSMASAWLQNSYTVSLLRTPCSGLCGMGTFCVAFAVSLGAVVSLLGRLPMPDLRMPPPPWRAESRARGRLQGAHGHPRPPRPPARKFASARVPNSRARVASTTTRTGTWDRRRAHPTDGPVDEELQILDAPVVL